MSAQSASCRRPGEPSVVAATIAGVVLAAISLALIIFVIVPLVGAQQDAPATVTEHYVHGPSQQVPAYGAWALIFGVAAAFLTLLAILALRSAVKQARKQAARSD